MKEHKYCTGMRTNRKEGQLFKNSINVSQVFVIDNMLTLSLPFEPFLPFHGKILLSKVCTNRVNDAHKSRDVQHLLMRTNQGAHLKRGLYIF